MHTPTTFLTPTGKYLVTSHGSGWAYTIACTETRESLWFQDHAAEQIQQDTNNFEDERAIDDLFFYLTEH